MKIKYLNYFFFFILLSISLNGCDLFGDEQHCKNEVFVTKTWESYGYVAGVHRAEYTRISFMFGASVEPENIFTVTGACPFGTIAIKVNIYEKKDISRPAYYEIFIYKAEEVNGKKIYRLANKKSFFDKPNSNSELFLHHELILDGLLDVGPVEFLIDLTANWGKMHLIVRNQLKIGHTKVSIK